MLDELKRRRSDSKKCGYLMKVEIRRDKLSGQGILQVLQGAHSHGPSTAATARLEHRPTALTPDTRAEIGNLSRDGLSTSQILTTLRRAEPEIPHYYEGY